MNDDVSCNLNWGIRKTKFGAMLDERKIRDNIERKIKMQEEKNRTNRNSSLLSDSSSKLKSNTEDFFRKFQDLDISEEQEAYSKAETSSSHHQSSNKFQLEEKWKEIDEEQQKITDIQRSIDEYRKQMITISKDEEVIKHQILEQQLQKQQELKEINENHKENIESLKKQQEKKLEECLLKIEKLIEEKAEFNKQCQKFVMEETKMAKMLKEQSERFKLEIKNNKQAFQAIEKEKRTKWEKNRVTTLKEQAALDTEPRIHEIINKSNVDVKAATQKEAGNLETFKHQLKEKHDKDLIALREKLFNENEQQKDKLRAEEAAKAQQRYSEMERQFDEDRQKMRQEYNKHVSDLEVKIRQQISEFITRNKESHTDSLDEIKKLREGYESKIKQMKNNIKDRVESELVQVERKHQQRYESNVTELHSENEQKYQKAQVAIQSQIDKRIIDIRSKVSSMKEEYQIEVDKEYDLKLHTESQKQQNQIEELRRSLSHHEQNLIHLQKSQQKQQSRNKNILKEIEHLEDSNYSLQQKITTLEGELEVLSGKETSQEKLITAKCKEVEADKRAEYQAWRDKLLVLEDRKQEKEKELVDVYLEEQQKLDQEIQEYKDYIEENLNKRIKEINKLKEEVRAVEAENEAKKKLLEEERAKMNSRG